VSVGARVVVENESVPFDRRVWEECRALAGAGYRVLVACPRGSDRDTEPYAELEGVRIHRFPLRVARSTPGYAREYGLALWHSLRILLARAGGGGTPVQPRGTTVLEALSHHVRDSGA
jgi:hypothetical protein